MVIQSCPTLLTRSRDLLFGLLAVQVSLIDQARAEAGRVLEVVELASLATW